MTTTLHPSPDPLVQLPCESSFLYAFVARRIGYDRALAEDLTQETLLAALQGTYDPSPGRRREAST